MFDKLYKKNYQHLAYKINGIRFVMKYIFIRYILDILDIANFQTVRSLTNENQSTLYHGQWEYFFFYRNHARPATFETELRPSLPSLLMAPRTQQKYTHYIHKAHSSIVVGISPLQKRRYHD